ncbi:MAG: HIT domain-containing protein [Bacilli bacterium]
MKFDENCIFCKIANKTISSNVLYEDDDVMAFLDTNPATYGHALVITKEHYDSFLSCPKEVMHKVMDVAQRIGQALIKELGAKGINIIINCYEAAGQVVKHFHVHVVPRYVAADGLTIEMKGNLKDLNLPAIAKSIKEKL